MNHLNNRAGIKSIWILAPFTGVIVFVILYVTAAQFYPGGTQFNKHTAGFDWTENYWCNLLNERAINGQINAAQPVALAAMFVLCTSLSFFWWQFPGFTPLGKSSRAIIRISGAIAMITAFFLFTNLNHDFVTNFASLCGLAATTGTLAGLYKNGWTMLYRLGLFNIVMVAVNIFLYYQKTFILYLPLVQKITFATFLFWICCINIKIFNLQKKRRRQ